jgi:cardiolipin synthase
VRFDVFSPRTFFPPQFPRLNFINHRKLVVVDNRVAFSGGMNVGDEYRYSWRDLFLRIEGPAVFAFAQLFLEDWYFGANEAIADPEESTSPCGDDDVTVVLSGPDSEPWIHDLYFVLITRAQARVWISTPYFIPTAALLAAMRTAAGRGVDVRVVVPKKSDVPLVRLAARSFYRGLVSAGVRIFEYEGPMLHAKGLLVDESTFAVGTANIDTRSLGLSYEVTTFVDGRDAPLALESYFRELLESSGEMTMAALEKQSTLEKLKESAAHLLSPLL